MSAVVETPFSMIANMRSARRLIAPVIASYAGMRDLAALPLRAAVFHLRRRGFSHRAAWTFVSVCVRGPRLPLPMPVQRPIVGACGVSIPEAFARPGRNACSALIRSVPADDAAHRRVRLMTSWRHLVDGLLALQTAKSLDESLLHPRS